MNHYKYTGHIKTYVDNVAHDLESVIPKEGHVLVKDSIMETVKRLADTATHNNIYLEKMFDEFLTMMENRHIIVDFREYDCWDVIPHEQLMQEFKVYLAWGLDAVNHFDDERK